MTVWSSIVVKRGPDNLNQGMKEETKTETVRLQKKGVSSVSLSRFYI